MDKKAVIKALTDHFGIKPKYIGAPSFAYQFETPDGVYTVDKAGTATNPEGNEVELKCLLSGAPIEGVSDPSAPSDPVDTADPDAPVDPSESEAPNDPMASDEPEAPAAAADPVHMEGYIDPDAPSDPA